MWWSLCDAVGLCQGGDGQSPEADGGAHGHRARVHELVDQRRGRTGCAVRQRVGGRRGSRAAAVLTAGRQRESGL